MNRNKPNKKAITEATKKRRKYSTNVTFLAIYFKKTGTFQNAQTARIEESKNKITKHSSRSEARRNIEREETNKIEASNPKIRKISKDPETDGIITTEDNYNFKVNVNYENMHIKSRSIQQLTLVNLENLEFEEYKGAVF